MCGTIHRKYIRRKGKYRGYRQQRRHRLRRAAAPAAEPVQAPAQVQEPGQGPAQRTTQGHGQSCQELSCPIREARCSRKRIASYLMGVKQDFNDSGSRRIKDWTTVFRIEKVAILKSWRKESDHGTNENRTISRQVIDMQYEFFKILVQKKIISKYQVY